MSLPYDAMDAAFEQAESALAAGEVPIGAVFVLDGHVIAVGCNDVNRTNNASRHAEIVAIDQLMLQNPQFLDWPSVTCYVTCEPCVMCASALLQLKVGRIVFGCHNERFGGFGSTLDVRKGRHDSTVTVEHDKKYSDKAINLLRTFYAQENPNAPEPVRKSGRTLKLIETEKEESRMSE